MWKFFVDATYDSGRVVFYYVFKFLLQLYLHTV